MRLNRNGEAKLSGCAPFSLKEDWRTEMAFAAQKEPASTGGEMGCWGKERTVVNSCPLLLEGQVLVSF